MAKPFKLAMLMLRIHALLRRSSGFQEVDGRLSSGGIVLHRLEGTACKNGVMHFDQSGMNCRSVCGVWSLPCLICRQQEETNRRFQKNLTIFYIRLDGGRFGSVPI